MQDRLRAQAFWASASIQAARCREHGQQPQRFLPDANYCIRHEDREGLT
jgi:hypothetical protein